MNYEEKKEMRKERYKARIEKAKENIKGLYEKQDSISKYIPLGQPILVGHHSEKRHRRDLEKIDSCFRKAKEESEKIEYYENKIKSIEHNKAISSDDPEAIEKLKEKLSTLQAYQEKMKAVNKKAKKRIYTFEMTNNNQNMNSIKKRIELLEKRKNDVTRVLFENDIVKVIDNVEDNRLQIIFNEKPSEEIRSELKRCGFKYAYTTKTYQRFRSNSAIYAAKDILKF